MSPLPDEEAVPAWTTALLSLIHPAKIAAVEAFAWIGEPMSALVVYEVLGRDWPFGTVAYHLRRLEESGVLRDHYVEPRRGAHERYFVLAM
jgi:hypothetical protein